MNSAVAQPNHDEILPLLSAGAMSTYTVRGYAYAGGGRRVNRVEVSLDEGKSWLLSDMCVYCFIPEFGGF